MRKCGIFRPVAWSLLILVAVLVAAGGCESGQKKRQGRFTEEQMEAFALVERDELPLPAGGLVLSIDKETITADEILSPMAEVLSPIAGRNDLVGFRGQAGDVIEQAIVGKVVNILLYQEARKFTKDIDEGALDKAVKSEIDRFVAYYGGDFTEADEAIKRMGLDWKSFPDYQKKLLLTQYYVSQELTEEVPVTHGELLAKYNEIKDERFFQPGQIQFRLIDIEIDKVALVESEATDGESKKSAALKLAGRLLERIKQGRDFGELAREYSNDKAHRLENGGLWMPVTAGSLAQPYDVLEKEAENMQEGDVSEPIESDGHIFIMKLESKKEERCEPFEDVQVKIEAEIELQRRKAQLDEAIFRLLKRVDAVSMKRFIDFCVVEAYRRFR